MIKGDWGSGHIPVIFETFTSPTLPQAPDARGIDGDCSEDMGVSQNWGYLLVGFYTKDCGIFRVYIRVPLFWETTLWGILHKNHANLVLGTTRFFWSYWEKSCGHNNSQGLGCARPCRILVSTLVQTLKAFGPGTLRPSVSSCLSAQART